MDHHKGCAIHACGHCYDCSGMSENPQTEREAFVLFALDVIFGEQFDEGGEG